MTLSYARRRFATTAAAATAAAVALPALLSLSARAQPRTPTAGREYRVVSPPQSVDTGNKIEVLEFFQYSCPHCYSFNPFLEGWRKKLAADVEYRRNPINWDNSTLPHTKIYYTLEALGRVNDMHDKVFDAYHKNKRRLLDVNEIADFMAANGFDKAKWTATFSSFAINTKAARAGQVWRNFKIDGTPAMAVDGKFVSSPAMVGSREGALEVLDFLIETARKERKK
jgi:thiol:disulfide interchange protein DsbA